LAWWSYNYSRVYSRVASRGDDELRVDFYSPVRRAGKEAGTAEEFESAKQEYFAFMLRDM